MRPAWGRRSARRVRRISEQPARHREQHATRTRPGDRCMGQASKRKRVPPMLTSSPGRSADSVTFTPFTKACVGRALIDDPKPSASWRMRAWRRETVVSRSSGMLFIGSRPITASPPIGKISPGKDPRRRPVAAARWRSRRRRRRRRPCCRAGTDRARTGAVAGSFISPQNWQRFGSATTGGGGAGAGATGGAPATVVCGYPVSSIIPSTVQPCFYRRRRPRSRPRRG